MQIESRVLVSPRSRIRNPTQIAAERKGWAKLLQEESKDAKSEIPVWI